MGLKIYDENQQLQFDSDVHSLITIAHKWEVPKDEFLNSCSSPGVFGSQYFVEIPITLVNDSNYMARGWAECLNQSNSVDLCFLNVYRVDPQRRTLWGVLPKHGNFPYSPIFFRDDVKIYFLLFRY